MARIHVGTSGWNYDEFIGTLYPENTPKRKFLETYCQILDTVELNASFYRSFPDKVWQGWYKRTPPGFLWSVKASRYITHIRRLEVEPESVKRLLHSVSHLREKLAMILFQLPPGLPFDQRVFTTFLDMLPEPNKVAIEARHPSWHKEDVWKIMKDRGVCWVVSHTDGRYPMTIKKTGPYGYIRLHGTNGLYKGRYGKEALKKWLDIIKGWHAETFLYFDNTASGDAAVDALTMTELLSGPT